MRGGMGLIMKDWEVGWVWRWDNLEKEDGWMCVSVLDEWNVVGGSWGAGKIGDARFLVLGVDRLFLWYCVMR